MGAFPSSRTQQKLSEDPVKETKSETISPVNEPDRSVVPLVPAEINLESFPWAPVRLAFLSGHPLALLPNPEPFRALVLLIAQAWRKQPAMTAPNDDVQLAAMAGFGRDVNSWLTVRESVMQDWVLCSDGRWHHPELTSWALQSWEAKMRDERFSAKQSARARSRKAATQQLSTVEPSHGSATAQPYMKEQKTDTSGNDNDKKEDDVGPEAGPPSPNHVLSSVEEAESGAQDESKRVYEDHDVALIFEHWKQRTGRPGEKLTHSRQRIIKARLLEGFSPAQICRAIDFAAENDFYQGRSPKNNRRIDTLDVICKDADRILTLSSSGVQSRPGQVKQAVRDTAESFLALLEPLDPDVIDLETHQAPKLGGGMQ